MMTTNEKSTLSRTGIWVCAGLLLLAAGLILFLALQPAEQAKNKSAAVLSVGIPDRNGRPFFNDTVR